MSSSEVRDTAAIEKTAAATQVRPILSLNFPHGVCV